MHTQTKRRFPTQAPNPIITHKILFSLYFFLAKIGFLLPKMYLNPPTFPPTHGNKQNQYMHGMHASRVRRTIVEEMGDQTSYLSNVALQHHFSSKMTYVLSLYRSFLS